MVKSTCPRSVWLVMLPITLLPLPRSSCYHTPLSLPTCPLNHSTTQQQQQKYNVFIVFFLSVFYGWWYYAIFKIIVIIACVRGCSGVSEDRHLWEIISLLPLLYQFWGLKLGHLARPVRQICCLLSQPHCAIVKWFCYHNQQLPGLAVSQLPHLSPSLPSSLSPQGLISQTFKACFWDWQDSQGARTSLGLRNCSLSRSPSIFT